MNTGVLVSSRVRLTERERVTILSKDSIVEQLFIFMTILIVAVDELDRDDKIPQRQEILWVDISGGGNGSIFRYVRKLCVLVRRFPAGII